MSEQNWHREIRPRNLGTFDVEPFDHYVARVQNILPNFPSDVLKDWIYRHYDDAIDDDIWLEFQKLRFEKQAWPIQDILDRVQARRPSLIDGWKFSLINDLMFQRSSLGSYMIAHATWPTPPIILNNIDGQVIHPDCGVISPYHLIEGHHRLAYLYALYEHPAWQANPAHEVWLVTKQ